jgi:hypothetical protein
MMTNQQYDKGFQMSKKAENMTFYWVGGEDGLSSRSITLQQFLDTINAKIEEVGRKELPSLWKDSRYTTLVVEKCGPKHIKIIATGQNQRSVYCFLDYAGNIYKAATWRAPAKHIRGSIFDKDCSWGKGLGPYGAAYLR